MSKGENRHPELLGSNYFNVDIKELKKIKPVLTEIRPNIIIHCAAISEVDICENNPIHCDVINFQSTKYFVDYSEESNTKFICVSTDFVFEGNKKWMNISDLPISQSECAKSKYKAERYITSKSGNYSIIRPVFVYGFSAVSARKNIFSWVYQSLTQDKTISVVEDQIRTPTFCMDVVNLVFKNYSDNKTGVFHIGGADVVSVFDFASKIKKNNYE